MNRRQFLKQLKTADDKKQAESRECKAGAGPTHREVFVQSNVRVDLSDNLEQKYETYDRDDRTYKRKQLFWARFSTVLIAGYAAITIGIYCANKKAAEAARDAVKVAESSFRISQGAYVTIGRKDGVIADFIIPKDRKQDAEIVIYFQNSGHLPAKFSWGTMAAFRVQGSEKSSTGINYVHPFVGLSYRSRDKKTGAIGQQGEGGVTIPADSVVVSTLGRISQKDLAELPTKHMGALIMGNYAWCDQFGTYELHTFGLRYRSSAPSSSLSFDLGSDSTFPKIPVPPASDTTEYLPPCKTINEQ